MALFVSQAVFLKQAVVTGFGGTIRALPLKMPRAVRDLFPGIPEVAMSSVRLAVIGVALSPSAGGAPEQPRA